MEQLNLFDTVHIEYAKSIQEINLMIGEVIRVPYSSDEIEYLAINSPEWLEEVEIISTYLDFIEVKSNKGNTTFIDKRKWYPV